MGIDTSERLVKPPEMDVVTSGRLFRPSSTFKKKYLTMGIIGVMLGWALIAITLYLSAYIAGTITGTSGSAFLEYVLWTITPWYILISGVLVTVGILIANAWINSIEYSVVGESGEAMPEIYVKAGIIDVTEKHVPLRTITNVSSRAGPFDRIFGIGNVFIETAGSSPIQLGGMLAPDIKIEGIRFYHELRDHIVREMRKLKGSYATGTEISSKADEFDMPTYTGSANGEMAFTLREMLKVLRRIEDKLDNLR